MNDRADIPTERHLQCIWYDSLLRPGSIASSDNEQVSVENPGRWNLEAGPDFLDAVLSFSSSQRKIRGDIEIHIRAEDWIHHKHTQDGRYDNVVAHVTYFPGILPSLEPGTVHIALKPYLDSIPSFSFENIDLASYPHCNFPRESAPCAKALAEHSQEYIEAFLEKAGRARLENKSARMAGAMKEKDCRQVFYEEFMGALGYKHNRNAFRQLAERVPFESLFAECGGNTTAAYALLLGVAGLIPSNTNAGMDRQARLLVRVLWDNWWRFESRWSRQVMPAEIWRTSGVRPQNHPLRRIAAAAGMFARQENILEKITSLDTSNPGNWRSRVTRIIQEYAYMSFWNRRLSFTGRKHGAKTSLIGPQRAASMITNIVVPYLDALGRPVEPLLDQLFPEQEHSIIRQSASALLGRDHNPALYRTGLRQQGLIHIFRDYCTSNRTGCDDCALAKTLSHDSRAG